jgi:hypothetical protein
MHPFHHISGTCTLTMKSVAGHQLQSHGIARSAH